MVSRPALILGLLAAFTAATLHAAPVANVQVSGLPATTVVGGGFGFSVSLANGGTRGYAPYIDVIVNVGGADNVTQNGPCDGIVSISATMSGVTPANTPLKMYASTISAPCPPNGPATVPHPLAAWGVPPVAIGAGAQLFTFELPFGSYDASQPPIEIAVSGSVHNFADVGVPLFIRVGGGFALGGTELNDSGSDPPVLAALFNSTVTPLLADPAKSFAGAENELAPGPSFVGTWTITITPPPTPGKPLTSVTVKDCLHASTTLVSVVATPPTTTTVAAPCFTTTWATLATPGTITVKFHGNNTPPWQLPPCGRQINNMLDFKAAWKALDPRDTGNYSMSTSTGPPSIRLKSIATQKTAKPGPGGVIPGSTVSYTIDFQLSDYLRFGELQMLDTMSDGVTLVGVPRLSVSDRYGSIVSQPMPAGTFNVTLPTLNQSAGCFIPARTMMNLGISKAMAILAPNVFPANTLTGALAMTPASTTPAVGRIEYTVTINDQFAVSHFAGTTGVDPDDKFVGKDDPINDQVIFTARQYSLATPPQPLAATCNDDTRQCLAIDGGALKKSIVGKGTMSAQPQWLNPVPDPVATPLPKFAAGDSITFLIAKTVASGDAQTIVLQDWVPKPVLNFTAVPQIVVCNAALPPAAGQLCYRSTNPSVTMQLDPPAIGADGHLELRFKPFNNPANTPVTLEVYISLPLLAVPFADGLHLTNEVRECEYDSYGKQRCEVALAKFEMTEPMLRITKGIVASSSPMSVFTPAPPSTVAWNNPGTNPNAQPRFLAPIVAPANAMTSDVTADANDVLTYAIVVENTGTGLNGAHEVTIKDTPLPPGLVLVGAVQVTDGTGAPIPTTPSNASALFSPTGIKLNPPVPPASAGAGKNVIVITFNVRVTPDAPKGCPPGMIDTASITHYAAAAGGPNFVAAGYGGPFSDSARACVVAKADKCIIATSEAHTAGQDVVIGEIVRYRLTMRLPEGVIVQLRVVDALPPGLAYLPGTARAKFISNQNTITSPMVPCQPLMGASTSCTTPLPMCVLPSTAVSGGSGTGGAFLPGDDPVFSFGDVSVSDNDADEELLVIELNAVVVNYVSPANLTATNQAGVTLPNSFTVYSGTTKLAVSSNVPVRVVEPALSVAKTIAQGPNITYPVTITNPQNGVTAFDVTLIDVPPACLGNPVAMNPAATGGASMPVINGNLVTVAVMPPGSSITVTYALNVMCVDCEKLVNKVEARWTSLPGLNGTVANPTGSVSGASGSHVGDRTGAGGPNDYINSATQPRCGTLCGVKFHDLDADGVRDTTPELEPTLGGWKITAAGPSIYTATTSNADGKYCMTVVPGTYQLCEQMPIGPLWKATKPPGGCTSVNVGAAGATTFDFGNESDCYLRVCGHKFNDQNGDTTFNPGEPMLAGWTIFAIPNGGAGTGIYTATTDAAGKWCMLLPGPGYYFIREAPQSGWLQTFPPKLTWNMTMECGGESGIPGGHVNDGSGRDDTFVILTTGGLVRFGNRDVCAGKCAAGTHCVPTATGFTCVANPATSPCASTTCPAGLKCAFVNGAAVCVP